MSNGYSLGSRMGQIKPVVTATMPPQPSNIAKGWQQRPLRLAVTPAGYDDIGEVLRKLGFTVENIGFDALDDLTRLRHYDAVFVNCHQALKDFYNGQAIVSYVANGGILYASDYACSSSSR